MKKKLYFRLCQPWGIHIANMSKELYYVDESEIRKKFLLLKSKKSSNWSVLILRIYDEES